jgi:hypothetical protein
MTPALMDNDLAIISSRTRVVRYTSRCMTTTEKLARSVLGKDCEPISFELAGKRHRGWRRVVPLNFRPVNDPGGPIVRKYWRDLHEQDIRLFLNAPIDWQDPRRCGSMTELMTAPFTPGETWGYSQVLAIPRMETLDIVELCKVGGNFAHVLPDDPRAVEDFEFCQKWTN